MKSRKLLNAIRTHLLEMVTQLACISSEDNLTEGPGSVTCSTEVNSYLLHWFLGQFVAVHKGIDVLTKCDRGEGSVSALDLTQPSITKLNEETPHSLSFLKKSFYHQGSVKYQEI